MESQKEDIDLNLGYLGVRLSEQRDETPKRFKPTSGKLDLWNEAESLAINSWANVKCDVDTEFLHPIPFRCQDNKNYEPVPVVTPMCSPLKTIAKERPSPSLAATESPCSSIFDLGDADLRIPILKRRMSCPAEMGSLKAFQENTLTAMKKSPLLFGLNEWNQSSSDEEEDLMTESGLEEEDWNLLVHDLIDSF